MITIKQLMEDNKLELVSGVFGINRPCHIDKINRLGLELVGFFEGFERDKVILLGGKETLFMSRQDSVLMDSYIKKIFSFQPPCIIFSSDAEIFDSFIKYANEYSVPVLKSNLSVTPTSAKLYDYLHDKLAPIQTIHGTLMDINGMGTLIIGKSGIGKSEIALDLIKKGNKLVADDSIEIIEREPGVLVGTAPNLLKEHIEIRGIGIVNVVKMFGIGAYRTSKKIDLVVLLEEWQKGKTYDRLGLEEDSVTYFNTVIPQVTIPVTVGRSIALLIESAAMNEKLKVLGYNSALEFVKKVDEEASLGGDNNE